MQKTFATHEYFAHLSDSVDADGVCTAVGAAVRGLVKGILW